MAKSFLSTLNLSSADLKAKRATNFVMDAQANSELLVKQKEMAVRELENKMERIRDLGDDTTLDIARRISKADPMETVHQLHVLNLELKQAKRELADMKAFHAELFPEGEEIAPANEE